ncbi:Farnesyl pyrophosphate synthase [Phaffia rhodozyma]|uniref:Squalene synthase n=1 Tax=Phaffia rhodozyma TaxID=264483 RepID=A0A0F7SE98_PHARH|nr:Farnesyl pyrophosphate synthase [Phaffia rhodozyma]
MGISDYLVLAFTHPADLRALMQYAIWHEPRRNITAQEEHATSGWDRETMKECWKYLDLTSRSFAAVIKELDGDLTRVICLFYLALRGLDTIEDDMSLSNDVKLPLLRTFWEKLDSPGWTFTGSGPNEKDRELLVHFDVAIAEFANLDVNSRNVIRDITRKMGNGMADFASLSTPSKPVAEVQSTEDFNLYCHYVAGLVGEGLSRLFVATEKERPFLANQMVLSNSFGLLLQKTNILRDIREDADEGRGFWPREIWANPIYTAHAPGTRFNSLTDLVKKENIDKGSMWVLSAMTLDAITHTTDALDYLSLLKNQSVFNFCAIPAVMSIATLELCFMNPAVFQRNIKIRKGEAVELIMKCNNPREVAYMFRDYARKIHAKAIPTDPNFIKLSVACGRIEQWAEHYYPSFMMIRPSNDPQNPAPSTALDPFSGDARLRIASKKAEITAAALVRKKARDHAKWRESKGLPPSDPNKPDNSEDVNWVLIGGMIVGLLLVMGVLGLAIAWVVLQFEQ